MTNMKQKEDLIISDSLDRMFTDRLGERQRKLERMSEMEHRAGKAKTLSLNKRVLGAVAACVIVLIMVAPIMKEEIVPLDYCRINVAEQEYRAAFPDQNEIDVLMAKQDFDNALKKVKHELKKSDTALKEYRAISIEDIAEEWAYEEQEEQIINSELRWTYIYLLLKTGQDNVAKKELKRYMKHKEWCNNWDDALALQAAFEEKDKNYFEKWVTFYASLLK